MIADLVIRYIAWVTEDPYVREWRYFFGILLPCFVLVGLIVALGVAINWLVEAA